MKFISDRPLADPDTAAPRLVEIADGIEAVQDAASGARRKASKAPSPFRLVTMMSVVALHGWRIG